MSSTPFTKRFQQLVKDLTDTELGYVLGISADAARKMRNGDIKTLKLHAALRLARELGVTPWYIAGETEPEISPSVPFPKRTASKSRTSTAVFAKDSQFQDEVQGELQEIRKSIRNIEIALHDLKSLVAKRTHS